MKYQLHFGIVLSWTIFLFSFASIISKQHRNQKHRFYETSIELAENIENKEKYERLKLNEVQGFYFKSEYHDAVEGRSLQQAVDTIERMSTFPCSDQNGHSSTAKLIQYHQYFSPEHEYFQSKLFLQSLTNRTLGLIGDSLGMQTFHALDADLEPYLDKTVSRNGNGTHEFYDYFNGIPHVEEYPRLLAAYRYYRDYNVTILWCRDNFGDIGQYHRRLDDFCALKTIMADVVVVLIGPHYKMSQPKLVKNITEHYELTLSKASKLEAAMYSLRKTMNRLYMQTKSYLNENRKQQVIWKLNSHVGSIDEYNVIFPYGHGLKHSSRKDFLWDVFYERENDWLNQFNAILRSIALYHDDYILDQFRISKAMLRYENDRIKVYNHTDRVNIHADSLHYCAGGLFRSSNIVLQKIIQHFNKYNF